MGLKTRLSTSCTKRHVNPANLVTSRKINTKLARPIRNQGPTEPNQPLFDAVIID